MSIVVDFRDVVAVAGSFPVLTGVDVRIDAGELVLLSGANGAGKTSLLRACAGLQPVSAGSAEVLGYDLRVDRRAPRRYIGLLGHENCLYRDLRVREHIEFRASVAGLRMSDASDSLGRVGLDDRLWSAPVAALSAGQRRKLAIASIIVSRPRLWLLDEPHAALDSEGRLTMNSIMEEVASLGATVVFASHDKELSEQLASRVITMSNGRLTEDSGAS